MSNSAVPRSRSSCSPTSRRRTRIPETTTADNELLELARRYGLEREDGIPIGFGRGEDHSNPVISVNHDACILCDRCVRADDIQGNDVIGRSGGYTARIAFDLNDPMGESSCVTCGECVAACPTGALVNKPIGTCPSGRAPSSTPLTRSVPTAASAARSPTTSTGSGTPSPSPKAASSPAPTGACASRAATAGTTRSRRSG